MECPFCTAADLRVLDTRSLGVGRSRRKRLCRTCGERFYTLEVLDVESASVVKRDGRQQPFSRSRIARSIRKSTIKGSELTSRELDAFIDRVTRALYRADRESRIPTRDIGHAVLDHLRDGRPSTDVTCVRYSIVFLGARNRRHGFGDVGDFIAWLRESFDPAPVRSDLGEAPVEVINRYGIREPFDMAKIARSVGVASKGRGSRTEVKALAGRITHDAVQRLQGQAIVSTLQVAQEVLTGLKQADPIAYLRYASAVKRYASVDDFMIEAVALQRSESREAFS